MWLLIEVGLVKSKAWTRIGSCFSHTVFCRCLFLWPGTYLRKWHAPFSESNGAALVWGRCNECTVGMETFHPKYGFGQEQIQLSMGLCLFTAGLSLLQCFVFSSSFIKLLNPLFASREGTIWISTLFSFIFIWHCSYLDAFSVLWWFDHYNDP